MVEEVMIQLKGLKKVYDISGGTLSRLLVGKRELHAVDGVDLEIKKNRVMAVVGESGCGKSTLAKLVSMLIEPTAGSIWFRGENLQGMDRKRLKEIRREIQLIFQDPFSSLNPRKRVVDLIGRPLELHYGVTGAEKRKRVLSLMEQSYLNPEYIDRYPHEFSGGQRQRIAIARALATDPSFLIADEPVSALDVSVQAQILRLLQKISQDRGLTVMFISHDLNVVRYIADEVAVMYAGQIIEYAAVDRVFDAPQHPYTRALLEANPDPDMMKPLRAIEGEPLVPINVTVGCRFAPRCPLKADFCLTQIIPLEEKTPGHQVACLKV